MGDYFAQPSQSQQQNADSTQTPAPETPLEPFPSLSIEQVLSRQTTANAQSSSFISLQPAVRLRSLRSRSVRQIDNSSNPDITVQEPDSDGRRRSASLPQRPQRAMRPTDLRKQATEAAAAAAAAASTASGAPADNLPVVREEQVDVQHLAPPKSGRLRSSSNSSTISVRSSSRSRRSNSAASRAEKTREYDSNVVDVLDVIDPEIATLNTLNNIQNSLFIPNLGRFFDRRQTYNISRHSSDGSTSSDETPDASEQEKLPQQETVAPLDPVQSTKTPNSQDVPLEPIQSSHTLDSVLSGTSSTGHNYAVLPHGTVLEGWSEEDKAELNDHVRHLLHSKRAGFKRKMRGFGKFVSKPLGFLVTLWGFLITFWGAAWVLFLIGWIYVGKDQAYFVEICDQVLTALFCIVGIGLSPWRTVDTYHMIYIAIYHYRTWRLRREQGLPDLADKNELPAPNDNDVELARGKGLEDTVLTPEAQAKLVNHQTKYANSHTFYRPHETFTHNAFPIKLMITITVLLDCHSLFQMALGGTTWGIYYKDRPKALTAVILSCSISCNISAGIVISWGDRISRKKEVVEQIFRQTLTQEAIHKLEKKRGLHASKRPKVVAEEKEAERKAQEKKKKGIVHHVLHPHDVLGAEQQSPPLPQTESDVVAESEVEAITSTDEKRVE